ncbi:MAG: hypothetical protein AUK48_04750 [Oscillatoriales cyanobacterium CG2_30_44_21]|nr:MAG: hypothetical protein AUK48_04750 [Oscillatoriales cyanobacterium CG2_30_44_21]
MELAAYLYDAWAYEQAGQELSDHNYVCDQRHLHCDTASSNDWNFPAITQKCWLVSSIALTGFSNLALPELSAAHHFETSISTAPCCHSAYLCDSSYISEVQTLLSQRGFTVGAIDGVYGQHTKQAVIDFQKTQPSLVADGIAGEQTLTQLRNFTATRNPIPLNNSSVQGIVIVRPITNQDNIQNYRLINSQRPELDELGNLQILLKRRGFYQGAIDSRLGQETTNAILKSQIAYGLIPDGVVGPLTIRALLAGGNHLPLAQPAFNRSPSPENIMQAQQLLRERGFYGGEINGLYEALTRSSIFEAQLAYAQNPTGDLEPALLTALRAQDLTQPLPTISQNPPVNQDQRSGSLNSGSISFQINPQVNIQPVRPSQSSSFSSSQNAPNSLPPAPAPNS